MNQTGSPLPYRMAPSFGIGGKASGHIVPDTKGPRKDTPVLLYYFRNPSNKKRKVDMTPYEISVDVREFQPDEISVTVKHVRHIVVEAKHTNETVENGVNGLTRKYANAIPHENQSNHENNVNPEDKIHCEVNINREIKNNSEIDINNEDKASHADKLDMHKTNLDEAILPCTNGEPVENKQVTISEPLSRFYIIPEKYNTDLLTATLTSNGLLKIVIPKASAPKPAERKVAIFVEKEVAEVS